MELKCLGFFGIFRESFENFFRWKKTFVLITLALILPLSAMNLTHSKASEFLFSKIIQRPDIGAYKHDGGYGELAVLRTKYGWIALWLSKVVYFTFYLAFSLLPTSAVVGSIFAIYINSAVTFGINAMMNVFPRVVKRLLVTFLWSLFIYLFFNLIFFGIFFVWFKHIWISASGIVLLVFVLTLYIVTLIYMVMVWQLANVVAVLEDVCGAKALLKGEALMKGKKNTYLGCFLVIIVCLAGVHSVFEFFVLHSVTRHELGLGLKFVLGLTCLVIISILDLFRIVNHTVIYFVCKSKQQEEIELDIHHDDSLKQLNV